MTARGGQKRDDASPALQVPPHPDLPGYYEESDARQGFLNDLFDRTAGQYGAIDRAISFGSGPGYRRRALRYGGLRPGMRVLDVACGTGLTTKSGLDLVGPRGYVVGLDPSSGMLREARKVPCRNLVQGVGEELPFPDASFDFLSMGYALRHVSDLRVTFREYRRVLRPGGIVFLLEIAPPRPAPLLSLSRFYLRTVVGAVFARATGNPDTRTLMRYWWDTMEHCVAPETILAALGDAGFVECALIERFGGFLRNYRAVRAGS